MYLGKQRRIDHVLEPLQPHGKSRRNSWLQVLDQLSFCHFSHLEREAMAGRSLLNATVFQIKINKRFKEKKNEEKKHKYLWVGCIDLTIVKNNMNRNK